MPAIADVPKPDPLQEALRILTSAFPPTKFKIENGQITGGGITVAPGLIKGSPLAMVRIVAAQLKAIEDKQHEDARKTAEGSANAE